MSLVEIGGAARKKQWYTVQKRVARWKGKDIPRRSWQKGNAQHEKDTRNELDSPCSPEGGLPCNKGTAVTNKVHDENTPLDRPLLDDDDGASLFLLGDFGQVYWDLRRGDTDANTIDEATTDQHGNTVGPGLQRSSQEPPKAGKEGSITTTDSI